MRAAGALVLSVALTLSACGDADDASDDLPVTGSVRTVVPVTTTEASSPVDQRTEYLRSIEACGDEAPDDHAIVPVDGPAPFELETVVEIDEPTVITFTSEGRAFIGGRGGEIHVWTGAGVPVLALDLSDRTAAENDQGLVGMDVAADDAWLYVNHTVADGDSRVAAFPLVDGVPDAEGERTILEVDQPSRLHNGGDLVAADDGTIFVTFGDGGGLGDRWYNAQNRTTRLGSILRLEPRPGENPAYAVPDDNPFAEDPTTDPLIYVYGVRNPFRYSLDESTGRLFVADFGQQCVEELDVLAPDEAGANLGWNVFEGDRRFVGGLAEGEIHREPDLTYWHTDGWCGIIGGEVYRGSDLPDLVGSYVFTDYCKGELVVVPPDLSEMRSTGVRIDTPVDITSGPDGELYVVSLTGSVARLAPALSPTS